MLHPGYRSLQVVFASSVLTLAILPYLSGLSVKLYRGRSRECQPTSLISLRGAERRPGFVAGVDRQVRITGALLAAGTATASVATSSLEMRPAGLPNIFTSTLPLSATYGSTCGVFSPLGEHRRAAFLECRRHPEDLLGSVFVPSSGASSRLKASVLHSNCQSGLLYPRRLSVA